MASVMASAAAHKGPVGPLRHRCALCSATGTRLLLCGGCRAVRYCGREHQVDDRPRHKTVCNRVKNGRAKVAKEDYLIRHAEPDFSTPANAFETEVGRFWGFLNTRPYMRARYALADNLRMLGTLDSVGESLDHLQDMLRLCRNDNLGVRDLVPALMLRLDRDQACYDFVKWWATFDFAHRSPIDAAESAFDVHPADVLEDPDWATAKSSNKSVCHLAALVLFKLKLLTDVRNVKIVRKIAASRRLPSELQAQIERAVVRSPLSAQLADQSSKALDQLELKLQKHACIVGGRLALANHMFVHGLFDPDEALEARPEYFSHGSLEEAALALNYSYAAYWETEGVLPLLQDARACAARDSADEVDDRRAAPGDDRTAEEFLEDLSVNRIWGYLGDAVQNSTYLGPWSSRPSEELFHRARAAQDYDADSITWAESDEDEDEL